MCDKRQTSLAATTTTVTEALEAYRDVDELRDERLVRTKTRELFGRRSLDRGEDGSPFVNVWAYLLTAREQLAFLAYLCVRKGVCEIHDLHLEHFEDQGAAVAVTLLLSEYEPAIALSPIASRERRVQLAVLTSGFWDALQLGTFERENRLMLLG